MSSQYYLAFDYGTQYIGTAIGQTLTKTANPLVELRIKNNQLPWGSITKLVEQWLPGVFIIGLPLYEDGSESPMALKSKTFATALSERFNRPHILVNERLSTYAAKEQYYELKNHGIKSQQSQHCLSAVMILQSYFNEPLSE